MLIRHNIELMDITEKIDRRPIVGGPLLLHKWFIGNDRS